MIKFGANKRMHLDYDVFGHFTEGIIINEGILIFSPIWK